MISKTQYEVKVALEKAIEAMKQKNKPDAFFWASQAARMDSRLEEPWLIMAAVSHPRASLKYLQHALEINPQSQRAQKGIIWANKRLEVYNASLSEPPAPRPSIENTQQNKVGSAAKRKSPPPSIWMNILLFWVGLLVVLCTGTVAVSAFASGRLFSTSEDKISAPLPTDALLKASITATLPPPPTNTISPSETPLPTATESPSPTPTLSSTPTSTTPTAPPIVLAIPVTPLPAAPVPKNIESAPSTSYIAGNGERWIDIDLSKQMLYAFEGNSVINSFLMSSGLASHPTITGQYHIYVKYRVDDMQGPGYFLPNVPYVLYFYEGYGIHGTYWHSNFGTPMSHGCINLRTTDAEWLYDWAAKGTLVNIHY